LIALAAVAPLQQPDFTWPTLGEIKLIQDAALPAPAEVLLSTDAASYTFKSTGAVWIPDSALGLQQHLLVVAYAHLSGHRGRETTLSFLQAWCLWSSMIDDVAEFVRSCLHCLAVSSRTVPRPLGEQLHATRPNELIHADFMSLPVEKHTAARYVLVIKDDFSGFCELYTSSEASTTVFASALVS